ncbi:MAG: gamma-glutamylcyclotransferase [Candidatus Thiodiazotropha sp. (ex Monitilora ramsayi)]|nr:gamma-glutamylcyclotransferase [Candidatus Thiodiazotropha sp. (ex Monitilora ramsayi)]
MSDRVFVYGTLRRGEVNHHLMSGAKYCGGHVTLPRYRMIHLGAYPGVVEGGNTAIVGEIFRVNGQQLVQLDRLEDYPRLYNRKLIPTPWGSAWIYTYRGVRNGRPVIPGGDWLGQQRPGPFSLY